MWLYGSGFPKSLDVGKAIGKAAGPEQETGVSDHRSATTTADAERWKGWGTTLKPAWEPILVARKPLDSTVAANVLAHSTGALNIDDCRIGFACEADEQKSKTKNRHADFASGTRKNRIYGHDTRTRGDRGNYDPPGRWPANLVLSHTTDCKLVGQTRVQPNGHHPAARGAGGISTTGHGGQKRLAERSSAGELVDCWECSHDCSVRLLNEQSDVSPSRFFYSAKASRVERDAGLGATRNTHPTVKPIGLMRWLVRLVTPPGGTVLDPFAGSGSTGVAAVMQGARFLGVERETDYVLIARARIRYWARQTKKVQSHAEGCRQ